MSPEITKIIDQYLKGELSPSDQIVFEKRLAESEVLQKEVELQKSVYEAAKRASTRTSVRQAGKKYHFTRKIKISAIALIVLATIAAFSIFVANFKTEGQIAKELAALMAKLEKESLIGDLKSEFFLWEGQDDVVLTQKGVLLSIPANAFLLNGELYTEKALIQWQEALDAATIVKSGLSTMSGDKMLETQGMFVFQAFTPDGKRLEVNPKVGVYVQVPVDEYKTGMQLFEGKPNQEGIIDWQNPKPLMKIPVPVDMAQLDFYPVGYEDSLNRIKLRKDKKYRDSLYLSFSTVDYETSQLESGKRLFTSRCATCHQVDKDGTGPKLSGVRKKWFANALTPFSISDFVVDWTKAAAHDPYAAEVSRLKPTAMATFPDLSRRDIHNIFEYVDKQKGVYFTKGEQAQISMTAGSDPAQVNYGESVDPSKVLAFWNPKFNNTNLATRQFESRMRAIHSTCDDQVLEAYVNNLSTPLSEIDSWIVTMGHPEFETFVAEQVGALNPDNPHLKNLAKFYAGAVKQLQREVRNNRDELAKKQQKWDAEVQAERMSEQSRTTDREAKSLKDEYNFNMKHVHKQLGKTVGFQIYGKSNIFNIDKYVNDATASRASATIVDPESGKTAQITYNDFSFAVENATQYQKVYAYLFPSGINSYQRIAGKDGAFSHSLNNGMIYDLAVVGISDKGYSYFQQKTLKGGKLGSITLKSVSETQLNASVEQLNNGRLGKPMEIRTELNWLVKERQNYAEQQNRQEQQEFRHRVAKIIFPCFLCADSTKVSLEKPARPLDRFTYK